LPHFFLRAAALARPIKSKKKQQDLQKRNGDTPDTIRALFALCSQRQKDVSSASFEKLRERFIQEIAFPRLPYTPTPDPDVLSQAALASREYQYRKLVQLLKAASDDLRLWYWLAVWFRSEGIREPDKFLPADVYRKLTKEARQRSREFLSAAYYNSYLVRTWLPYTEPLLRKTKWLRQGKQRNAKPKLQDLGYDMKVLKIVEYQRRNWRSAVEFTCAWLVEKGGVADAETLRNGYSLVFGRRMLSKISCSFCEKPAVNEFWAYSESVPHCGEHGADQLPTSEDSAWADPSGRGWWRQDLEICCTTSVV
jgi:hypothetical protein